MIINARTLLCGAVVALGMSMGAEFTQATTIEGISVSGVSAAGVGQGYSDGEASTGSINGGSVNTAYFATGAATASPSYLNSATTSNLGYSLSSPGSYQFTLYFAPPVGGTAQAINLFLDSATAPSISAWALDNGTAFNAESSSDLLPYASGTLSTVSGSGSLSYNDGADIVTLSALTIDTDYAGIGSLGYHTLSGSSGGPVETVTFTLNVSAPEPGSLSILGVGLAGLVWLRRVRRPIAG